MTNPYRSNPAVLERSRAMWAELDAAPQDRATQNGIAWRHVASAHEDLGIPWDDHLRSNDLMGALLSGAPAACPLPSVEELRAAFFGANPADYMLKPPDDT